MEPYTLVIPLNDYLMLKEDSKCLAKIKSDWLEVPTVLNGGQEMLSGEYGPESLYMRIKIGTLVRYLKERYK
jgi:hypothetical protein